MRRITVFLLLLCVLLFSGCEQPPESVPVSSVVSDPYPKQFHPLESITMPLLDMLQKASELHEYSPRIDALAERYRAVFAK